MSTRAQVARKRARLADELARTTDGYVPTPTSLADKLAEWPHLMLTSLADGARVLEPSAGTGVLVTAVHAQNRHLTVVALEPDPDRADQIRAADTVQVGVTTLEEYAGGDPGRFDAVIMNPPWSRPGNLRLWADHVVTAFRLLHPGGRLAAIVPGTNPAGPVGAELLRLVAAYGGIRPVTLDRAAIRSGFPASCRILWLVAPVATPDGLPPWVTAPAPGTPVVVKTFNPGPSGVAATPVQEYLDWADGYRPRVIRFAGTCASCQRLMWAHDDGREDASTWVAGGLFASDDGVDGMAGADVNLCFPCAGDHARYDRAMELARGFWADAPGRSGL